MKFHNPRLILREVDWDGALVRAIPRVREAQTSEQLAQAIGTMLAELSDPVTRVSRQSGSRPAGPVPLLRWDGDVLIVSIGPYRESIFNLFSVSWQIAAELPKATAVVFQVLPSPPLAGSGEKGGLPARYVFIAGEELPDQAAALWWSGHAAIVAEAPLSEDRIARTRKIDLGGHSFSEASRNAATNQP